jgi:hypothetical protein
MMCERFLLEMTQATRKVRQVLASMEEFAAVSYELLTRVLAV